jgi:hypothetical protein
LFALPLVATIVQARSISNSDDVVLDSAKHGYLLIKFGRERTHWTYYIVIRNALLIIVPPDSRV